VSASRIRVALIALILLAFALRVANLGAQELRGDEAFGYFFVQNGYSEIIEQTIALDEPHPVASYFVQKPWMAFAGESEFALRFVGVWFSVLTVALLARLGRRLQLAPAAILVACGLLAISPYAIWHAQDARMYSMSLALTLALVWLAIEALSRRRWQWIAAYVASTLLALHTHYFVAYVLVALTLFVVGRALVAPAARRAAMDWFQWNIIAFLLYLPWLARASSLLSGYGGNGDSPVLANAMTRSISVFAVGETLPTDQRLWWALLAGASLLLGIIRLGWGKANDRRTLWLLLCLLSVPLLLTWYSAQSRPIFNERYLVAAAPAFYLLLGASLQPNPRRRWLNWLSGGLLAALAVGMALSIWHYQFDPAYSKSRGWREVAARAEQLASGMDASLVRFAQNYPEPTLWYYLRADPHLTLPPAAQDIERATVEVARLADEGIERVILIQQNSPQWDDDTQGKDGIAATTLRQEFMPTASIEQSNFSIAVFDRSPGTLSAVDFPFDDIYLLEGVAIASELPTPNGVLAVTLAWESLPILPDAPHKITLQVLGPDGAVIAQQDASLAIPEATPTGEATATHYGILLPDALPAGAYRLIAAVYDPNAEGLPRLSVGNDTSAELARWNVE